MVTSLGGPTFKGINVSHPAINSRLEHNITAPIAPVPARGAIGLHEYIMVIIFLKITITYHRAYQPHYPNRLRL